MNVKHNDPNIESRLVSVLGGKICAVIRTVYPSLMYRIKKNAQPKHFIQPHYKLLWRSVNIMHHYNY